MVDLDAFPFDVEDEGPGLALDVAHEVVVEGELVLGLEGQFNGDGRLRRHHSPHRVHNQRVPIVRTPNDTLLGEVEGKWDRLLIDDAHRLPVLPLQQQWSELYLPRSKHDIRFYDSADYQEFLDDFLLVDLEEPVGLVLADVVGGVFEDHLELLAAEDDALHGEALEHGLQLLGLIRDLLPLELVALVRRVHSHEALGVLDVRPQTAELYDLVLVVGDAVLLFVLLFPLHVRTGRQLEMNYRPLRYPIHFDDQGVDVWREVLDVA
mmetsp:Transcript_8825/g.8171  ORF Transcript_8825/g.8171 Transcript_8825/m.8171 type:complete len:265 (-) Transcript_8825:7664-8458(-)